MKQPKISILIPFLNEADNIDNLVKGLSQFFSHEFAPFVEVIFIDDGSTDRSVGLLQQANHEGYMAKIIKLSKNYGSHAALRAGIQKAEGEYITFVYADLQDPLVLVEQLYQKCKNGVPIAWAVRNTTQSSFFEGLFSRVYATLMQRFAISDFPKKGFDVVMFNRQVQQILNNNLEANSSLFLQILTLGFKQDTITYDKQERKAGKSKWTLSKKIKLFIDSFVAFSYYPVRLVSITGILFFVLGLMWTLYIITRELMIGDLDAGWPALLSILMIGFGITNIALGIIAEYLWRTLDAARNRPIFIVDEVIEL